MDYKTIIKRDNNNDIKITKILKNHIYHIFNYHRNIFQKLLQYYRYKI